MIFFAESGLLVKFGSFYNGIKIALLAHKKMPLPRQHHMIFAIRWRYLLIKKCRSRGIFLYNQPILNHSRIMQQHSFIPLRHEDPLHKHIHNFAFPDGFFVQTSSGT